MGLLQRVAGGLRGLFRRREVERELDEELRGYLEAAADQKIAVGMNPEEARRAVRLETGSPEAVKDRVRDVGWESVADILWRDVQNAWRALRAAPVGSTIAILSLALGIGANTAIFSIVNSLLLKPLPVREPERLIALSSEADALRGGTVTYDVWTHIRDDGLLGDAFAWSRDGLNVADGGETVFLEAVWASGKVFDVLGVPAIAGRTFTHADDRRDGGPDGPVAVAGYGFARRRFGSPSDAVGKSISVSGVPFTIVGVTPPDFYGLDVGVAFDVILPLETEPLLGRRPRLDLTYVPWLQVMARLPRGGTIEAATNVLQSAQPQIREATLPGQASPEVRDRYLGARWAAGSAAMGSSQLRARYGTALLVLLAIVGIVLLAACVNIANLQLARVTARRAELGVRAALGASRLRLVGQLFVESLVLSALGAALGLLLAFWGTGALVSQLSTWASTAVLDLSPDWRVFGATMGLTVATTLVFGTAPALRVAHVEPTEVLAHQPRGGTSDGRSWPASILTIVQVALSLVLIVGAGLFLRSFAALAYHDLGFDRSRVLVAVVDTTRSDVPAGARAGLYERLRSSVEAVPGVERAALSMATPMGNRGVRLTPEITVPGDPEGRDVRLLTTPVSPGWFETYGTRLLAGRDFEDSDRVGARDVAIVNETFARRYFGRTNPLGRTLLESSLENTAERHPVEIVGLVENAAFTSDRNPVEPMLYRPLVQTLGPRYRAFAAWPALSISVRAIGDLESIALRAELVEAATRVDPNLTVEFQVMTARLRAFVVAERLLAVLSGFFGVVALLLAGLGIYGVAAYGVSRRRTEIGVRMALGATPARVMRHVLARTSLLVGLGLVVGVGLSLWVSRFIAAFLYNLEPRDPATLTGAALVLALVALLAGWLPARSAAGIDPNAVLREG